MRGRRHKSKRRTSYLRFEGYSQILRSSVYTNKNGYYEFKKSPRGQSKLVHRTIAHKKYLENLDNYSLPFSKYIVHHKDHDKRNNDISNLQIMTKEEHHSTHGLSSWTGVRKTHRKSLYNSFFGGKSSFKNENLQDKSYTVIQVILCIFVFFLFFGKNGLLANVGGVGVLITIVFFVLYAIFRDPHPKRRRRR